LLEFLVFEKDAPVAVRRRLCFARVLKPRIAAARGDQVSGRGGETTVACEQGVTCAG